MLSLRLVIDTNILVSAALKREGLQNAVLLIALAKPARFYVSDPIIAEYRRVLSQRELGISRGLRLRLLQQIRNRSYLVSPRYRLDITSDPDDNIFLECADAARADYVITGNVRHFPAFWKNTKIVTAREFLSLAAPHIIG